MAGRYPDGGREVQRRAGVLAEADRLARGVSPMLPEGIAPLMAGHRLAVVSSIDERGRVWASLLTGPPGFLRRMDERLMLIESQPAPFDPLRRNLAGRPDMGVLAIDLLARR